MIATHTHTVSIFLLTYNQEGFIAQTIDSIVGQNTDFNYQLVIGEDYSADTTRAICESYAQRYPDKIKLLPDLGENIGLIANYMRTIKECAGKYIAICDGDDYWTDQNKLQKQVDFLESNPECSIVYTDYAKLFPDGSIKYNAIGRKDARSNFENLLDNNFIPSVTALFKNRQKEAALPKWIEKYPYGDWPTYLWTLRNGDQIGYIDEETATYRMDIGTSASLISKSSKLLKVNLGILLDMYKDACFSKQRDLIASTIKRRNLDLMTSYNREKKFILGLRKLFNNLVYHNQRFHTVKLYAYSLYKNFKK